MVHGPHDEFESDSSSKTSMPEYLTDKYDPYTIYSGGTDPKGHFVKLRVSVPPGIAGAVSDLVQEHAIDGITNSQHVYRDAIVHRLRTYHEMKESTDPLLAARLLMAAERARAEAAVERMNQQRIDDEVLLRNTSRMLKDGGVGVLAVALTARNTIITLEFRDQLDREIEWFRQRV